MTQQEEIEALHRQSLLKVDDLISRKKEISTLKDDHEKLDQLKSEWQLAWNKLMETLLVLERLEI